MKSYKEAFESVKLKPCELIFIRELAEDYKKRMMKQYHVEDERQLNKKLKSCKEEEETMKYYGLLMCNRLIKNIPELPKEVLEQGFQAETDNTMPDTND